MTTVAILLNRAAFALLLALLSARLLISENYERLEFGFLAALNASGGPTPALSAWLDFWLLFISAAVLAGEPLWRHGRRAWLIAIGLLLAAVLISTAAAGERRLAASLGANAVASVLAAAALVRVLREPWMPRVLLAGMLAAGGVNAVKCLTQVGYEFSETLVFLEESRPRLAELGIDLTAPAMINYERRLQARDAFGYLGHPNVTASCLMMCALVAAGAGLATRRGRFAGPPRRADVVERGSAWSPAPAMALLALCGVALPFTGSLGALAAAAGGVVLLIALAAGSKWLSRHARWATGLTFAGLALATASVLTVGLATGTLPHPSLAFRWSYWTSGLRGLMDAPWTGLGRGNFLDAFLLYRPVEAAEETRDPHSLWLTLGVELGLVGLLAGGVLFGLWLRGFYSGLASSRPEEPHAEREPPGGIRAAASWMMICAAVSLVVLALTSRSALQDEQGYSPALILLWSVEVAGAWLVLYAALAWGFTQVRQPLWLSAGVGAAVLAGVIHNSADMTFSTPAGLALLAGLTAAGWALAGRPLVSAPGSADRLSGSGRDSSAGRATPKPAAAPVIAPVARVLLVRLTRRLSVPTRCLALFAIPLVQYLLNTRPMAAVAEHLRSGELAAAVLADDWDSGPPRLLARDLLAQLRTREHPSVEQRRLIAELETSAFTAYSRNPNSAQHAELLAESYALLATRSLLDQRPELAAPRREQELRWRRRAVERNPNDPRLRIELAAACLRDGPHARAEGRAALDAAERIDQARPEQDAVRLRDFERARLAALRAALDAAGP